MSDEDAEDAIDVSPEAGTPFVLSPFQEFIVGNLVWMVGDSREQEDRARAVCGSAFASPFSKAGRAAAKRPLGAGILIYMLVRRGVRGASCFAAAQRRNKRSSPLPTA